jgi:hypothetical protein
MLFRIVIYECLINEVYNAMVNNDELIRTTEELILQSRCRINLVITGFDCILKYIKTIIQHSDMKEYHFLC